MYIQPFWERSHKSVKANATMSKVFMGVSKTQTSQTQTPDPKNSDPRVSRKLRPQKLRPLGVSKTQTQKTQTLGCLENSDPKNSDPLGVSKTQTRKTQTLWVSRKLRPENTPRECRKLTCLLFVDTVALPQSAEKRKTVHSVMKIICWEKKKQFPVLDTCNDHENYTQHLYRFFFSLSYTV